MRSYVCTWIKYKWEVWKYRPKRWVGKQSWTLSTNTRVVSRWITDLKHSLFSDTMYDRRGYTICLLARMPIYGRTFTMKFKWDIRGLISIDCPWGIQSIMLTFQLFVVGPVLARKWAWLPWMPLKVWGLKKQKKLAHRENPSSLLSLSQWGFWSFWTPLDIMDFSTFYWVKYTLLI